MKLINILMIAAIAVVLSGCGGGGGGGNSTDDTAGPTFSVLPTAVYNDAAGSVVITTSVTDPSGISTVKAVVNGATVTLSLVSGSQYSTTYNGIPKNTGTTSKIYTVAVTATDSSSGKNTTTRNVTFTVAVSGSGDTTGPTFTVPPTADYSEVTGSVIFIATVTDASGIFSLSAFVNGISTDLTLVSGNTYSGTYNGFPDNFGASDLVYTAVVTATDNSTKKNTTSANAQFTVPVIGPPPPPSLQLRQF